jgi:UDP-N-acetylglucosamine--N-acetylmuramyl-(pentapeptide) pyrophosphoryl-undecaprenol N-acetylglucosamine transferase
VSILIIGGSQGAGFLNTKIVQLLADISLDFKIKIIHQAGDGRDQETQNRYQQLGHQCVDLSVMPFITSMNEAYEQADLIICRSGALTVAEVAKVGLPAVFIPFPHAVDDHQTANAQALVDVGAAVIVQERNFMPESVRAKVVELIKEPLKRQKMAAAAKQVMPANSAEIIADKCLELMV